MSSLNCSRRKRVVKVLTHGFCDGCGYKFEDDARFCSKCGRERKVLPVAPVALNAKGPAHELEKLGASIFSLEKKLEATFDEVDNTCTGFVAAHDPDKLRALRAAAQKHLGMQFPMLPVMFDADFLKELNVDGTGKINRSDFVQYFVLKELDVPDCHAAIFDAINVSRAKTLEWQQLKDFRWYEHPKVFQLLGFANFTSVVSAMGNDEDLQNGEIDFAKFEEFMERCQGYLQERAVVSSGATSKDAAPQRVAMLPWKLAAKVASEWHKDIGWKSSGFPERDRKVQLSQGAFCPDFADGYCPRFQWCWQWHGVETSVGNNCFVDLGAELGFNFGSLSDRVLAELQSVPKDDAERILQSVGIGRDYAFVQDKTFFVVQEGRRKAVTKSAALIAPLAAKRGAPAAPPKKENKASVQEHASEPLEGAKIVAPVAQDRMTQDPVTPRTEKRTRPAAPERPEPLGQSAVVETDRPAKCIKVD